MTERGLPIVGGAPACPFVAFEDDRDERATSPDHRHRCYAEAQPAPRALAHQEAYCLSSAFPVCPTFQDWARREAARARPQDLPPSDPEDDEGLPLVDDRPPRRGNREVWAAPPPWMRAAGSTGTPAQHPSGPSPQASGDDEAGSGAGLAAADAAGAVAGGLSGSFADRLASDHGAAVRPGAGAGAPRTEDWQGAPGSAAPVEPPARPARADARPGYEDDESRYLDEGDADASAGPQRHRHRERGEAGSDRMEARERDIGAPSWERPRRLEAYPTIRSRRLSNALPTVALGLIALLLAVAAFVFVPQLLGNLGSGGGASPTPAIAASVAPSGGSFAPTIAPAATPFTYIVKAGDTMTKIAKRFGVSLNDLIAANKDKYPDPNKIAIGDSIIIPVATPSSLPGASAGP